VASTIRDPYDLIHPRKALYLILPWKQPHVTAVVPLLVVLALIGAACGDTTTQDSPSPGGTDPTSQSTDTSGATGYEVGQLAPDFVLTSDEGQRLTLASLRAENRSVVLYFFTTW